MSHRSTLRAAALAAVAAAAVLVPSTTAFADASPQPTAPGTAIPEAVPGEATQPPSAVPAPAEASETPTEAPSPGGERPAAVPRGGVAAGEQPAGNGGGTTALYGSAIGAVMLAGAGTIVLRRRTSAHRTI